MVAFEVGGRQVRFDLPLPDWNDAAFTLTPTGRKRLAAAREAEYEQAIRQRWRALTLVVKAKLEAVEAGIVTFDDEFLANLVLPGGATVGQAMGAQLPGILAGGEMPALLPGIER